MFKLLSIPVWTALLFHVVTVFGPVRVPVIFVILILITASVVTGFSENRATSAEGKDVCGFFCVCI